MNKLRVCVVFGGRSGEHEVSLVSGASVMAALDPNKYEIIPVGISKTGRWIAGETAMGLLKSGADTDHSSALVVPDPNSQRLVSTAAAMAEAQLAGNVDVVIPVLHGPFGEDGTVQGLLELANLPYVGAGVLGSAVCMDKVIQKKLCRQSNIPVVDYLWFLHGALDKTSEIAEVASSDSTFLCDTSDQAIIDTVKDQLGFPVFVKPANMGSSVGITKARKRAELLKGIAEAGKYDNKVIIEAAVPNAREIEVSVLGNLSPRASVPGEVVPSNEFYDYDAKYVDGKSALYIPARLSEKLAGRLQDTAVQGFIACNCEGMARVDFLLERESDRFYLNELNTIPGFTQISMYPKLWQASGLSYPELLDELIRLALERHARKNRLLTSFQPKQEWYR